MAIIYNGINYNPTSTAAQKSQIIEQGSGQITLSIPAGSVRSVKTFGAEALTFYEHEPVWW